LAQGTSPSVGVCGKEGAEVRTMNRDAARAGKWRGKTSNNALNKRDSTTKTRNDEDTRHTGSHNWRWQSIQGAHCTTSTKQQALTCENELEYITDKI
jgi:hypothetical protein